MGVSGSGKTTVGRLLAETVGGRFIDADAFHPPANIEKLRNGRPLTEDDRWPWLDGLVGIVLHHDEERSLIIACSALKEAYRQRLGRDRFSLVYLKGSEVEIAPRLENRRGHFMPADLLASQFADLEEPEDALTVSISCSPDRIVRRIIEGVSGLDDMGAEPE
jgi:gluconokinase